MRRTRPVSSRHSMTSASVSYSRRSQKTYAEIRRVGNGLYSLAGQFGRMMPRSISDATGPRQVAQFCSGNSSSAGQQDKPPFSRTGGGFCSEHLRLFKRIASSQCRTRHRRTGSYPEMLWSSWAADVRYRPEYVAWLVDRRHGLVDVCGRQSVRICKNWPVWRRAVTKAYKTCSCCSRVPVFTNRQRLGTSGGGNHV